MVASLKKYPIKHLINWYYGNYCVRKCFDKEERLSRHGEWLREFAEKHKHLIMTHKEFLTLFHDHMTLCTLEDSFKRRSIGWKLFERLRDTPNYDSDKIIVKDGRIKTVEGELESPKICLACKHLGVH